MSNVVLSFVSLRTAPVAARMLALTLIVGALGPACASTSLGRPPDDLTLKNDGTEDAQARLFRGYEVVYERGAFRRPGADPAQVGAEVHVAKLTDVAASAWSDDAYNYLSGSDEAAKVMEHPAVSFDEFAHSGSGELVLLGVGVGAGVIGGAISWFVPTTVRDGISPEETTQLTLNVGAGFGAGLALGVIVASAYTYIVPAVATPLAAPHYRAAARAFNDELEDRIVEGGPAPAAAAAANADAHGAHEDAGDGACPACDDTPCDGDCPGAADKPCAGADGKDCCCAPAGSVAGAADEAPAAPR